MQINLLFSIDDHFTNQLMTTIYSIYLNSRQNNHYTVYVVQETQLKRHVELTAFFNYLGIDYVPIILGANAFKGAPVSSRYPRAIYYRLLAHEYLPTDIDKILYLDADILCINDLSSLYEQDISDYLYAAAMHTDMLKLTGPINKIRLDSDVDYYFNSGVLLMNLNKIRQEVSAEDIFNFIREYRHQLLLPDQDVLNKLYGENMLPVSDALYNYDVRKDFTYQMQGEGQWSLDWVLANTVFLHFCGTKKPWLTDATTKYATLYKYIRQQLEKLLASQAIDLVTD
ncbi:glycosyltransferase family 8 protein [Weissella halotolerans]|nr:glycosyltransferase family 8 protein [Weissella halotolerans]